MDKLLYFPYCNIPESGWTIKSVLYWDQVGIIVPPSFREEPERHDEFTRDLLTSDLIDSVFPYEYTYKVKHFDKGFIEMVDNNKVLIEKRQKKFSKGQITEVYIQKFGEELLKYLIRLKLAKKKDYQTYYVEIETANLIMLYLASVIGKVGDFTPATDEISNLDLSITQSGSTRRLNRLRQELIDDLIPYPVNPNLTKLRKFKDKYHEELHSFRILLEKCAHELSSITVKNKRKKQYSLTVQEILDKKEKIIRELKPNFPRIFFGTVCGVGGTTYGIYSDNSPLTTFSIANSLYQAFQGYDVKNVLARDYSYLALIDKKLSTR